MLTPKQAEESRKEQDKELEEILVRGVMDKFRKSIAYAQKWDRREIHIWYCYNSDKEEIRRCYKILSKELEELGWETTLYHESLYQRFDMKLRPKQEKIKTKPWWKFW